MEILEKGEAVLSPSGRTLTFTPSAAPTGTHEHSERHKSIRLAFSYRVGQAGPAPGPGGLLT